MTLEDIRRLDPRGMYDLIRDFPRQVEEAERIGRSVHFPSWARSTRQIVLAGLGGSAVGGDLLRTLLAGELAVPLSVIRHYCLPTSVNDRTLVIVSSYSGNTEETIASYKDAIRRRARILCITSDGEILAMARRRRDPVIVLPRGFSPRAALGFSFFPLLIALARMGFVTGKAAAIRETRGILARQCEVFSDPLNPANAPRIAAEKIHGRLPVIYAGAGDLESVVVRWRGQICENAKQLAFANVLPEMNHNELVGWSELKAILRQTAVVVLRDGGMHPRVARRMDLTKQIVERLAGEVIEVRSEGRSPLARMFSLVYFGDWVSLYLAVLNGQDPTPVAVIDQLKRTLAES